MVADRNTKFRTYWAANILVYLGTIAISYQVGRLNSGQLLWLLLSVLFVAIAAYEAILGLIVAEDANAKLSNWQETLTDRFAQEEIASSVLAGHPPDFTQVWQRSREKMISDIQADSASNYVNSPISWLSSGPKLLTVVGWAAAMNFAVTILPAIIARFYYY